MLADGKSLVTQVVPHALLNSHEALWREVRSSGAKTCVHIPVRSKFTDYQRTLLEIMQSP
jgi:hypothetical protein